MLGPGNMCWMYVMLIYQYQFFILKMLKDNCNEANLVKIEKETETVITYYRVSFGNLDNIKSLMNTLDKDFKNAKFSFYENKILD